MIYSYIIKIWKKKKRWDISEIPFSHYFSFVTVKNAYELKEVKTLGFFRNEHFFRNELIQLISIKPDTNYMAQRSRQNKEPKKVRTKGQKKHGKKKKKT